MLVKSPFKQTFTFFVRCFLLCFIMPMALFGANSAYKPMAFIDLQLDFNSLIGQKIQVDSYGGLVGDCLYITRQELDTNSIPVDIQNVPRNQRKNLLQNSSPGKALRVRVYGTVAHNGLPLIVADKVEILISSSSKTTKQSAVDCWCNQRVILGAVLMYDMDNEQNGMTSLDLSKLLQMKYLKSIPVCPAGGQYYLRPPDQDGCCDVSCTIHGSVED